MQGIINDMNIKKLTSIGGYLVLILLALVPFHAFWVVWVGSIVGPSESLTVWKEVIILAIAILALIIILSRLTPRKWHKLIRQPAVVLVGLIIGAGMLANILNASWGKAFLVGIKTTVVPLILFLAVWPFSRVISERKLAKVVIFSAVVVAILAIFQFLFMPTALLVKLGYGESTILPFQGVHPEFPFGRSFSTLGGPNQLGTYLIIPSAFTLALAIKAGSRRVRLLASLLLVLFVLAIVTTFSRSALVGLAVMMAVVLLLGVAKKYRLVAGAVLVTIAMAGALVAWMVLTNDNPTILDRFLVRGDLTPSGLLGGDEGHISSIVVGVTTLLTHPGGLGFGMAGPASFYAPTLLLTENWYLQIALEVGFFGLVMMLLLLAYIIRQTHQNGPQNPIRIGFIGALFGVMISAMFLHSLADSTLAIMLFGIGGLLSAPRAIFGGRL